MLHLITLEALSTQIEANDTCVVRLSPAYPRFGH